MKIVIGVAYDGTAYSGWQRQANTRETIQEKLEFAIACVANQDVTLFCAGRTDAGVHATGQIAHFDTAVERSERSWILGINSNLTAAINVRFAHAVDSSFHARYSAISRSYSYIIENSRMSPLATSRLHASWIYKPLAVELMRQAAEYLIGEHDFTSFRGSKCQAKSPIKTIHKLDVVRHGNYVVIQVCADAFLHHMVRNIAGVLIEIGAGEQPVKWCEQVLNCKDRTRAAVTAKANGLYLTNVSYPEQYDIPVLPSEIIIVS